MAATNLHKLNKCINSFIKPNQVKENVKSALLSSVRCERQQGVIYKQYLKTLKGRLVSHLGGNGSGSGSGGGGGGGGEGGVETPLHPFSLKL